MNEVKYKAGDYLITKDQTLFRIVDVYDDRIHRLYDIKSVQSMKNTLDDEQTIQYYKCVTAEQIKKTGTIVAQEDINEFMLVLYSKSST